MIGSTGTGSNAVSYTSLHNKINSLSAEEMFRKLSGESAGSSAAGVSPVGKPAVNPDGSVVSEDKVVEDQLKSNLSLLKPKVRTPGSKNKDETEFPILYGQHKNDEAEDEYFYDGKASITKSFNSLAVEIGAVGDKITKAQLMAYLDALAAESASGDKSTEIAFVKNLIAQFDSLSHGTEYITSLTGLTDVQDYTTVTREQVTPPIDIRV